MSAQPAGSVPADGVIRAAAELGLLLVEGHDLPRVLERVAHLSLAAVPGSTAASCTLLHDGLRVAAGYSSECLRQLEKHWYDGGFGPGAEAVKRGEPVTSASVLHSGARPHSGLDSRAGVGPEVLHDVAVEGLASVIAIPLVAQDLAVGVISLYSATCDAFTGLRRDAIEPFLAQAAVTVRNAQSYATATGLVAQLQDALASRAVIEQAKGAIMARRRVTSDAAFELLRRSSQRRNVKLRDVAAEVVASATPPPTP